MSHNNTNVKNNWIQQQLVKNQKADTTVLQFIADILFHSGDTHSEPIRKLFRVGYCYYFAHMLQEAFGRGIVCYAYHQGHFVWLDGTSETKNIAYDIEGINTNWEHLIPEDKLGDYIWDFQHVKDKQSDMTDPEITTLLLNLIENDEYAEPNANSVKLTVRSYAKDIEEYQTRFINFFQNEFASISKNKNLDINCLSAKHTTIDYKGYRNKIPCQKTPIIELTFKIVHDNKIDDVKRKIGLIYQKFVAYELVYDNSFDYIVNIK